MNREFTVAGMVWSVDDVMINIPNMFRDEFVGVEFATSHELSLCLAHADTAFRAKIEGNWKYDDEVRAMRAYLKK